MSDTVNEQVVCDICDKLVPHEDLCTLYIQGIKEKLSCHSDCIDIFFRCNCDFDKLHSGKLKRTIFNTTLLEVLIKNTGITIREKQGRHVIDGLKISNEEGLKRIHDLATIFYTLPEPNVEKGEFYSIDERKQLVLKRKIDPKSKDNDEDTSNLYRIIEASRE